RIRVLFFGILKELVGRSSEEADFPPGADVGAVFTRYAMRHPHLSEMAQSIVMARNQEFAESSTPLAEGDEIALLPPVSGGVANLAELAQDGHYFALTRQAIHTRNIVERLMTGAEGAVVTFEGTVRNNTNGRRTRFL